MAGNFSASASEEENSDANLKTKSPDNTKTKAKGPPTLPKTVKDPYLTCLLHCIMAPRTFSDTQQFQFAIDDLKYKSGCFMKGAMAKEIRREFDRSLDDDCDIFCGIKVRQENALRSFLFARDSHGGSDEDTKQKFLKRLSWRFSEDLNILTSECYKFVGRGTWCNEDMLQWLLKANRFEHSVKHVLDDGNCLFYAIQKGLEHGEILQPSRNSTFERDLRWFVTEYIEIFCKGSNLESLPFAKATEESIMLEAQQPIPVMLSKDKVYADLHYCCSRICFALNIDIVCIGFSWDPNEKRWCLIQNRFAKEKEKWERFSKGTRLEGKVPFLGWDMELDKTDLAKFRDEGSCWGFVKHTTLTFDGKKLCRGHLPHSDETEILDIDEATMLLTPSEKELTIGITGASAMLTHHCFLEGKRTSLGSVEGSVIIIEAMRTKYKHKDESNERSRCKRKKKTE
jgi:hypothetical protein